jgi:hypothetical protein
MFADRSLEAIITKPTRAMAVKAGVRVSGTACDGISVPLSVTLSMRQVPVLPEAPNPKIFTFAEFKPWNTSPDRLTVFIGLEEKA